MMRQEQGTVMVMALVLVLLIGSLASIMLQRSQLLARDTMLERGRLQTLQAAEGGIAKARHSLWKDPAYRGETLQVGRCAVHIEVTAAPRTSVSSPGLWKVQVDATSSVFGERSQPYRFGIRSTLRQRTGRAPEIVDWQEECE